MPATSRAFALSRSFTSILATFTPHQGLPAQLSQRSSCPCYGDAYSTRSFSRTSTWPSRFVLSDT